MKLTQSLCRSLGATADICRQILPNAIATASLKDHHWSLEGVLSVQKFRFFGQEVRIFRMSRRTPASPAVLHHLLGLVLLKLGSGHSLTESSLC